jgi:hypothetical protein
MSNWRERAEFELRREAEAEAARRNTKPPIPSKPPEAVIMSHQEFNNAVEYLESIDFENEFQDINRNIWGNRGQISVEYITSNPSNQATAMHNWNKPNEGKKYSLTAPIRYCRGEETEPIEGMVYGPYVYYSRTSSGQGDSSTKDYYKTGWHRQTVGVEHKGPKIEVIPHFLKAGFRFNRVMREIHLEVSDSHFMLPMTLGNPSDIRRLAGSYIGNFSGLTVFADLKPKEANEEFIRRFFEQAIVSSCKQRMMFKLEDTIEQEESKIAALLAKSGKVDIFPGIENFRPVQPETESVLDRIKRSLR